MAMACLRFHRAPAVGAIVLSFNYRTVHRFHYTTAYLQRPTVGRYKSVQRPTVGRYIHIASDLTRGYKWRRYKL